MSPWYPTPQHVALGPLALYVLCQVYNPEALRFKLESLPTVDRTLGEVEAAVRAACDAEGIVLFVDKSSRTHDGVGARYDMKKFMCQRGGANRQESYQRSLDAGKLVIHGVSKDWVKQYTKPFASTQCWVSLYTLNLQWIVSLKIPVAQHLDEHDGKARAA